MMDFSTYLQTHLPEAIGVIIALGWALLLLTGVEADRPLSGGIPGHADLSHQNHPREGLAGRLGVIGAWLCFGLISASLPFILWWIFALHERGV